MSFSMKGLSTARPDRAPTSQRTAAVCASCAGSFIIFYAYPPRDILFCPCCAKELGPAPEEIVF